MARRRPCRVGKGAVNIRGTFHSKTAAPCPRVEAVRLRARRVGTAHASSVLRALRLRRVRLCPPYGPKEDPMQKTFVRGTWQVKRAFSPCVITQGGGRTIYIAGHTGQVDDSGKSLAGDFDAQF